MNDLRTILFVYARDGMIQCLSRDEATLMERTLLKQGWTHTATINPARWIASLANGPDDPSDMLDKLQFSEPENKSK